jgi:HlyD family secretion protein
VDIIRDTKPQKKRKRIIWTSAVIVGVVGITLGVRSLPSALPTVEGGTIWRDTVKQGTMIRQVRGPGTLVPEQMRWITAVTPGRIDQIIDLPGTVVKKGDVIMRMSNPDVDMQLLQAEQQLSQAQAALSQLKTSLETQELQQRGTVAQVRTQYLEAKRTYDTNQKLFDENPNLVARATLDSSKEQADELTQRLQLEQDRLRVMENTQKEQIDAQNQQIERLQEMVQFNKDRLQSMQVTVPVAGVLAPLDIPLQEGQWVQSGQQLSRVVVPGRLKAEIRIPQTQAQEVVIGQRALIDMRTDSVMGRVTRIDPSVQNGTVTIDVMPDSLPPSARADLSVDGNVIIDKLDNVVYMGRPTFGQANSKVSIFKLTPDGREAHRVTVELGASSVNEMEVKSGLKPGDVVILSDMSQWDGYNAVKIKN